MAEKSAGDRVVEARGHIVEVERAARGKAEAERRCGPPSARCATPRYAANRNMLIGHGVGAAAVVAGGVMYYLGVRAGRDSLTVTPVAGEMVGLAVSGRF